MDKVPPEHLHFLFDEDIYVLDGHGDHPLPEKSSQITKEQSVEKVTENESPLAEKNDNILNKTFRGGNAKGIVIIINDSEVNEANEAFLFKGLNALSITIDDVAIVTSLENLTEELPHSKRLKFDTNSDPDSKYQILSDGNLQTLTCDPLSKIQTNQELKVNFWLALKELFK